MQAFCDQPPTRFRIKQWSPDFLNNTDNARKCLQWIENQEQIITSQEQMDKNYHELQTIIVDEMRKFYKATSGLKKSRKALKHKPKKSGGVKVWMKDGKS